MAAVAATTEWVTREAESAFVELMNVGNQRIESLQGRGEGHQPRLEHSGSKVLPRESYLIKRYFELYFTQHRLSKEASLSVSIV